MARYRDAIDWMVVNDDTEWVAAGEPHSVTAALVADLFHRSDSEVRRDLIKVLCKAGRLAPEEAQRLCAEAFE